MNVVNVAANYGFIGYGQVKSFCFFVIFFNSNEHGLRFCVLLKNGTNALYYVLNVISGLAAKEDACPLVKGLRLRPCERDNCYDSSGYDKKGNSTHPRSEDGPKMRGRIQPNVKIIKNSCDYYRYEHGRQNGSDAPIYAPETRPSIGEGLASHVPPSSFRALIVCA